MNASDTGRNRASCSAIGRRRILLARPDQSGQQDATAYHGILAVRCACMGVITTLDHASRALCRSDPDATCSPEARVLRNVIFLSGSADYGLARHRRLTPTASAKGSGPHDDAGGSMRDPPQAEPVGLADSFGYAVNICDASGRSDGLLRSKLPFDIVCVHSFACLVLRAARRDVMARNHRDLAQAAQARGHAADGQQLLSRQPGDIKNRWFATRPSRSNGSYGQSCIADARHIPAHTLTPCPVSEQLLGAMAEGLFASKCGGIDFDTIARTS